MEWQSDTAAGPLRIPPTDTINHGLARLAAWLRLPMYEGKPWKLSTHQGRKTFARFVALRDRTGLFALAEHLGHRDRTVTDTGYAGNDYALAKDIEAHILEQSVCAWEHMLSASALGGRAGAEIIAKRPRFQGARMKQDLRSYARLLVEAGLTPETIRQDAPIDVKGWKPENYTHEYFGSVTLTQALAMSLNTVAIRVGLEVGPKNVVRTAHRLGISSKLDANASIALGTSEVSVIELVGAYAPFANGGLGVSPHVVTRIRTNEGKLLYTRPADPLGQVIEPRSVAMMNTMMQETLISGTARKAEIPGWSAAGKTGTSQDYRDAWFIGYTANLVTGVWLGNDDNSPTKKATGGGLPVEVWTRFMRTAHQGVPVASLPSAQPGNPFSNLIQAASQVSLPSPPSTPQPQMQSQVPMPPVPLPSGGGYRPPQPVRTSAPPNPSARPEAAAGLDGWLMERVFGGNR